MFLCCAEAVSPSLLADVLLYLKLSKQLPQSSLNTGNFLSQQFSIFKCQSWRHSPTSHSPSPPPVLALKLLPLCCSISFIPVSAASACGNCTRTSVLILNWGLASCPGTPRCAAYPAGEMGVFATQSVVQIPSTHTNAAR